MPPQCINRAELQAELLASGSASWLVLPGEPTMLQDSGLLARATLGVAHRLQPQNLADGIDRGAVEVGLLGTAMEPFMRWLSFPQMHQGHFRCLWPKFSIPGSGLGLPQLADAAAQFLRDHKNVPESVTTGVLLGAEDWSRTERERERKRVDGAAAAELQRTKSTLFTPDDVERVRDAIMTLGDRGKIDGELGINEMKAHLASYPPFNHFVDWFTKERINMTHHGRYSKFSLIDTDDSGLICGDELYSAVGEYLNEMAISEPRWVHRSLELTEKHFKDRARRRYLRRAANVKRAKAEHTQQLQAERFASQKRARQTDGALPDLRCKLGLFVPRISHSSLQDTHGAVLSSLLRILDHTGAPETLKRQVQAAVEWNCASGSCGQEDAEVPTSHMACRIAARTLSEMVSLCEACQHGLSARSVSKLRSLCKRYGQGRLITDTIAPAAFCQRDTEPVIQFTQHDADTLGQAVIIAGDKGNYDGALSPNELQIYLSLTPFAHFIDWLLYRDSNGSTKFKKYDMMFTSTSTAPAGELGRTELSAAAAEYLSEIGQLAPAAAKQVIRRASHLVQHGHKSRTPCGQVLHLVDTVTHQVLEGWEQSVSAKYSSSRERRRAHEILELQREHAPLMSYRRAAPIGGSHSGIQPQLLMRTVSSDEVLWRKKKPTGGRVSAPHIRCNTVPQAGSRGVMPLRRTQQLPKWCSPALNAVVQSEWRQATDQRITSHVPSHVGLSRGVHTSSGSTDKLSRPHTSTGVEPRRYRTSRHIHTLSGASKMRLMCALLDHGDERMLDTPANQMKKAFQAIDTDGNQTLSVQEIKVVLVSLGEHVAAVAGAQLLHDALNRESNPNGVTYNGFVAALSQYKAFANTANQMVNAMQANRSLFGQTLRKLEDMFKAIDRDHTNTITCDELSEATKRMGLKMSQTALQDLFEAMDEDGTGSIDITEFVNTLTMHADAHKRREASRLTEHKKKPVAAYGYDRTEQKKNYAIRQRKQVLVSTMNIMRQMFGKDKLQAGGTMPNNKWLDVADDKMRAAFLAVNPNKHGIVQSKQFEETLVQLGADISQAQALFNALNVHGKNGVAYTDFVEGLSQYKGFCAALACMVDCVASQRQLYGHKLQRLADIFNAMAERSDVSGVVDFGAFCEGLDRLGIGLSAGDRKMLFVGFDVDGNGLLDLEEFLDVLESHCVRSIALEPH